MDEEKSSANPDGENGSKQNVFKVPVISKIASVKDKKIKKSEQSKPTSTKDGSSDITNQPCDPATSSVSIQEETSQERRFPISFRPKTNKLPSQIYKTHHPTASEYIERYSKIDDQKNDDVKEDSVTTAVATKVTPEVKSTSEKVKVPLQKLSYNKPGWSCQCDDEATLCYSLEVLKTGAIIDTIKLSKKEYFVFGRLPECDVMLEHPSISRHHAVLQFGNPTESDDVEFQKDGSCGFYLYDLASTHGTFLNKQRIPSEKYFRIKVGHMMKFGGSSRVYILQGPNDDEEMEAEETATELRDKARAARENKKELEKMMMGDDSDDDDEVETTTSRRKKADEDAGVTWGMLEDAVEESDEEEEEEEKELLSLHERKDPFYVKDPHKALRNFYEKEGMEIEFDCTERRSGQWNVRLELPMDTPSGKAVVAEVSLTGKKKDAVNNCALEACRLLDKYGMFKQSEHHRRIIKEWEKEDFYDSDEDQYWDRTGDLDKKRQQRKLRIGVKKKSSIEKPETYDSLMEQINTLEKEISEIEKQLENDKKATQTSGESSDPLEEFMQQVKAGKTLDSLTRSKMKLRLFEARKEVARLTKLAEIARPASLPALKSSTSKCLTFIGKMRGKHKGRLVPNVIQPPKHELPVVNYKDDDVVENDDEDDCANGATDLVVPRKDELDDVASGIMDVSKEEAPVLVDNLPFHTVTTPQVESTSMIDTSPTNYSLAPPDSSSTHQESCLETPKASVDQVGNNPKRKRTFGPTLPPDLKAKLMGVDDENDDIIEDKGRKKKRKKNKKKPQTTTNSCSSDPNYANWLPPDDQTGDGTTSLNAKYGY